MLLSLSEKWQVYCCLVGNRPLQLHLSENEDFVVLWRRCSHMSDLSVPAVPAEERTQGQITGSHEAKKTQLAGRNLPP